MDETGLAFYGARAVREAQTSESDSVMHEPFFVDEEMRDQYPSVGLLSSRVTGGGRIGTYRVLTPWSDRAVFRDYRVTTPSGTGGGVLARPLGPRVPICPGRQISLPILSRDGRELGARDESTASTKLFALDDDGGCLEVLDLGHPTRLARSRLGSWSLPGSMFVIGASASTECRRGSRCATDSGGAT